MIIKIHEDCNSQESTQFGHVSLPYISFVLFLYRLNKCRKTDFSIHVKIIRGNAPVQDFMLNSRHPHFSSLPLETSLRVSFVR